MPFPRPAFVLALLVGAFVLVPGSAAQRSAKYGADFLDGGVGVRALGMGGAYVGLANDASAGYWNAAGLSNVRYPEVAYMHAERFGGVVSYDYGAGVFPINARSTVGLALIRLGVDDIPNTLNAWDRERNRPLENVENHVSRFSYAHYAFFVSYARSLGENLSVGVSGKMIRGSIGEFASSWGYSFDIGAQYRMGRVVLGANLQDVSTLLQTWSVNDEAFAQAEASYADFDIPEGGVEYVLPVLRLGSGVEFPFGDETALTLGLDMDLAFDGQRAYAMNLGDISFHPRVGGEFDYKGVVALRAGLNRVTNSSRDGFSVTPAVGAGLNLNLIGIDYGFGDFAGLASDLGYTHRISLQVRLNHSRWERSSE
ncbi:MAG TPA: PorV/PorQ family protein [Rhodothermales bacterium]